MNIRALWPECAYDSRVTGEQSDTGTKLPDNLLALPLWAAISALALLSGGVAVGFTLLLTPGLVDADRGAGAQLLVISLPALALAIGVLGTSWARTARIDAMQATFLRHTVGKKLEAYLVAPRPEYGRVATLPALFERMETSSSSTITSYCYFHLFDEKARRFDILVKSNVFNFEIVYILHFRCSPPGYQPALNEVSYDGESLKDWTAKTADNPLLALVATTIHGSISEGYTAYLQAKPEGAGGLSVTYRLRQKVQSNFLTSPYLRRYFSEDAAIASYFFFAEAFASTGDGIDIVDGTALPGVSGPLGHSNLRQGYRRPWTRGDTLVRANAAATRIVDQRLP
jgi:uncharacterized membrane protein